MVMLICMKYQINQQVWLLDATQLPTLPVRVKHYNEDFKLYTVVYSYDNLKCETTVVPSHRLIVLPELLDQLQEGDRRIAA
jgi:hypothetical protein